MTEKYTAYVIVLGNLLNTFPSIANNQLITRR